ncbi:short chain dehydrogenase [Solimonas aquatica]|uniref:Short chain dehydrogenase n=1 Tax=Solimonas aquatica TaxID=489703 RepID=A0A1H9MGT6_9GAMM|nr:SDR family oxidoreductase [Solimonas aquatica]SER22878.1 short chain dehydrogenase [Solimonas aquatica]
MARIIVITGAGVGLGRALARRFASEGERVVLLGRTEAKLQALAQELGEPALALACDVGNPDSVRAAFAQIAQRCGRIDVLINNAAIYEPFLVTEATDAQILGALHTNLAGAIFCARAAIALMTRGAHIINVSSESVGMRFPYLAIYQSSKAGLEKFSEALHHELDPAGIRVSTVRAGQMIEEGKSWDIDPQLAMRFAKATAAAGLNLRERPLSHVNSVTQVFRSLIDLPADVHIAQINVHARSGA